MTVIFIVGHEAAKYPCEACLDLWQSLEKSDIPGKTGIPDFLRFLLRLA
jgi:hypothetical protein